MISGISSLSSYDTSSSTSSSNQSSLTLDQQETIDSVLSNYDSSSLSTDDAIAIVTAFEEAGIEASKELADSMESLGFDAQEIGTLAGVGPQGGGAGMPPPPSSEEVESLAEILAELLEENEDDTTSTSFESVLDYTSRILQLNDESKNEVMELLDTYTSDESEISSSEVSNIMKNSLKDILSDTSNYKNVSFYA